MDPNEGDEAKKTINPTVTTWGGPWFKKTGGRHQKNPERWPEIGAFKGGQKEARKKLDESKYLKWQENGKAELERDREKEK
jgi:hypothetical protein